MIRKILTVILSVAISLACVFGLAACNGTDGVDGVNGINGTDGQDGVGVKNTYIDENGDLIIELTDGKKINCGSVYPDDFTKDLVYKEVREGEKNVGYNVKGIGTATDNVIKIPSVFNGLPVVGIEDGAFGGCERITGVVIPDSVKTIGEKAFYECTALENVSVGRGLTASGEYAFGRCENLKSVNITDLKAWCEVDFANAPANPLYFAEELYIDSVLATQLKIPEGTAKIGDYAFYGCTFLESAETGAGVASIGEQAFAYCENLQSIEIGNGVTSIGDYAFTDCGRLESVTFGNKVNSVGEYAFNRCYELKSVTLPSSAETLGEGAFIECYGLKTVNLNEGLKTIGDAAFCGCTSLEKFIMPHSVTQIGFGMLMFVQSGGFGGGYINNDLTELVISNSLTEIPDFAFNGCNLKNVTVGNKVETIKYSSFYGCSNLQTIIIPKSVKKIESYAFYRCDSLDTVYYTGTQAEWSAISIGKSGNAISNATVTVYCYSEVQPATEGNFWHYVDGAAVIW